jgi:hypothetical protein
MADGHWPDGDGGMNCEQSLRALANLIILYANRDDIPQVDRAGHLRCAETLRKAQRGEMTCLEATEEMDAKEAAK